MPRFPGSAHVRTLAAPPAAPWLSWAFRIGVSAYLLYLVQHKLGEASYQWSSLRTLSQPLALLAAVLLVPVNLGMEAAKWRGMLRPLYPHLGFGGALQRVLAGTAVGFVTPNRWGEYAGRMLSLPIGHRTEAALATLLSRLAQLAAALLAGAVALLGTTSLALPGIAEYPVWCLAVGLAAAGGATALGMLHLPRLLRAGARTPLPARWRALLARVAAAAARLPWRQRLRTLGLGLLRYGIFILQFWFLLRAYGWHADVWQALQFASLLFLLKTLAPSIALAELGIREALALTVATALAAPLAPAFNATLALFVINLLLPALLGVVCLWRLGAAPATDA